MTPETLEKYAWARRYGWQAPVADIRSELYDALKASEQARQRAETRAVKAIVLLRLSGKVDGWDERVQEFLERDAALAQTKGNVP